MRRPFGRWRSRPPRAFGPPTSPARRRTTRRSRRPRRRSICCSAIRSEFAELKAIKEAIHAAQGGQSHFRGGDVNSKDNIEDAAKIGTVPNPLLAREIDVLYLEYLAKQVDRDLLKKMLVKSNAVERAFNVFRPKVDGKELTDNDVRRILRESTDSAERRATWEASKKVGPVVVGDLLELVALRNEAARNWASRTTTSCNSIAASRVKSRCSSCLTSWTN